MTKPVVSGLIIIEPTLSANKVRCAIKSDKSAERGNPAIRYVKSISHLHQDWPLKSKLIFKIIQLGLHYQTFQKSMVPIKYGNSGCRIIFLSPQGLQPSSAQGPLTVLTCTLLDTIFLWAGHVLFSPSLLSIQNQFPL